MTLVGPASGRPPSSTPRLGSGTTPTPIRSSEITLARSPPSGPPSPRRLSSRDTHTSAGEGAPGVGELTAACGEGGAAA